MSSPSVTFSARAKVNLHLDVLGKFPDGTHELQTLFERVDLSDLLTVTLELSEGIHLECDDGRLPVDSGNLVVRAVEEYWKRSGWRKGLRVELKKKIPIGGGLGGGSSNAAAALGALQKLSGGLLPKEALVSCARKLGADVAFFLEEVPFALGRGRGDEIEPLPFSARLWHVLVTPDFPISTQTVYGAFCLAAPPRDPGSLLAALRKGEVSSVRDLLYNALEPTVENLYPAIRRVKQEMEAAGLKKPMVSGSGSTVFALCDSEIQADSAAEVLAKKQPTWRVFVAVTA